MNAMIYPKCSTCRNAMKWFKEQGILVRERHIVEDSLSTSEVRDLHIKSGLPIKRFFNTSGMKYRELGLKDKISNMSDEACYELLATDGMLVKRPLVYDERGKVTLGFKVEDFERMWK